MNQDQIHKERDQWIDRYILEELSDQESAFFEEHLLFCRECRDILTQRQGIVGSIQNHSANDVFQTQRRRQVWSGKSLKRIAYFAAAAGVALVIGLFLFSDRELLDNSLSPLAEETKPDAVLDPEAQKEDVAVLRDSASVELKQNPQERIAYLEDYQANPLYESQIGIHTRSDLLRVESPLDSVECQSGASIEIRYQGAESDSLFLVLLNRRGDILSETKIQSPHTLEMSFPIGLYYWQLTNEEESLHTAKIFIRPHN